eukprot:gene16965-20180_t
MTDITIYEKMKKDILMGALPEGATHLTFQESMAWSLDRAQVSKWVQLAKPGVSRNIDAQAESGKKCTLREPRMIRWQNANLNRDIARANRKMFDKPVEIAGTLLLANKGAGVCHQDSLAKKSMAPADPIVARHLSKLYPGSSYDHIKSIDIDDFRAPTELPLKETPPTMTHDRLRGAVSYNAFALEDASQLDAEASPTISTYWDGGNRARHLATLNVNCNCELCQLDKKETSTGITNRSTLTRMFSANNLASLNQAAIPQLIKHCAQFEQSYQPGRPYRLELTAPLNALISLYIISKRSQEVLDNYIKLFESVGITNLDAGLPTVAATKQQDLIEFEHRSSTIGQLMSHTDALFLMAAFHAKETGRIMLARKLVAMARLYAKIFTGETIQMFNARHGKSPTRYLPLTHSICSQSYLASKSLVETKQLIKEYQTFQSLVDHFTVEAKDTDDQDGADNQTESEPTFSQVLKQLKIVEEPGDQTKRIGELAECVFIVDIDSIKKWKTSIQELYQFEVYNINSITNLTVQPGDSDSSKEYNEIYCFNGSSTNIYSVRTQKWRQFPPMLTPKKKYLWNSTVNTGSSLYTFGGIDDINDVDYSTYERFDLTTKVWTKGDLDGIGGGFLATCFDGNKNIYIYDGDYRLVRFNTTTNTPTILGNLKTHLLCIHMFMHNDTIYMTNLNINVVLFLDLSTTSNNSVQARLSSCFDGEEFLYIRQPDSFTRVSMQTRKVKQLEPHPKTKKYYYHTMMFSSLDQQIYSLIGDRPYQYDTKTYKWKKLAKSQFNPWSIVLNCILAINVNLYDYVFH